MAHASYPLQIEKASDPVATPRLLIYRELVEENIALMRRHLESVVPGSGFRHLATHVKTHKSAWAVRKQLAAGITKFKCTLNELDMTIAAGATDVFVAYPLVACDAERVAKTVAAHRGVRITAQIASVGHAERLAEALRRHGVEMDCLIDIDVGNHRTGIAPGAAPDLVRAILASRQLGALRIRGLHAYDGHNSSPDAATRAACAGKAMQEVVDCVREVERAGARVERIVTGGSPGFLPDLRELVARHRVDAEVDVSPGTWIYWDSNYEAKMPGLFRCAALLLAQVMDRPAPDLATLNLGHKRWAIDHGAVTAFSLPGVEVVSTSEEHTVLRLPPGVSPALEDYVTFVPKHVCPTVNLWETFTIVGPGGRIETLAEPVTGRNR